MSGPFFQTLIYLKLRTQGQKDRSTSLAPLMPGDPAAAGKSQQSNNAEDMPQNTQTMKCVVCQDCGWVCEAHPYLPWQGEHACTCGGAGAPCPRCNPSDRDAPPWMPKDFEIDDEG